MCGCKPELLLLDEDNVLVEEVVVFLLEVAELLDLLLILTNKILDVSLKPVRPLSIALVFHLVKIAFALN